MPMRPMTTKEACFSQCFPGSSQVAEYTVASPIRMIRPSVMSIGRSKDLLRSGHFPLEIFAENRPCNRCRKGTSMANVLQHHRNGQFRLVQGRHPDEKGVGLASVGVL